MGAPYVPPQFTDASWLWCCAVPDTQARLRAGASFLQPELDAVFREG
jgi:hypothetical protein